MINSNRFDILAKIKTMINDFANLFKDNYLKMIFIAFGLIVPNVLAYYYIANQEFISLGLITITALSICHSLVECVILFIFISCYYNITKKEVTALHMSMSTLFSAGILQLCFIIYSYTQCYGFKDYIYMLYKNTIEITLLCILVASIKWMWNKIKK